jgi:hypothetical protein
VVPCGEDRRHIVGGADHGAGEAEPLYRRFSADRSYSRDRQAFPIKMMETMSP